MASDIRTMGINEKNENGCSFSFQNRTFPGLPFRPRARGKITTRPMNSRDWDQISQKASAGSFPGA